MNMCLSCNGFTVHLSCSVFNPNPLTLLATVFHTQTRGLSTSAPSAFSSHHGQFRLQLLDAVLLEVELRAQQPRVLRGFLGLPPQVPLLSLQQVLLLGQCLHRILALLVDTQILMNWLTNRAQDKYENQSAYLYMPFR